MPTYADYLCLDELLSLQRPASGGDEHDEMLFIVIHQSYELWFKQVLHEIDYLQALLGQEDLGRAGHTMKRVLTILKMMVAKIDILETMTPLEFLTFRDLLESGSGFESAQFRELEFALGHKRRAPVERIPRGRARERLEARYDRPTLWDSYLRLVADSGFDVPREELERDVTRAIEPSPAVQAVLIEVYRTHPALTAFSERLVDLDEGIQEWRYRHVKMVERTIGTKRGTGGSTGAAYLHTTLGRPLFPDLWAIRTEL
jgi:tryptophan 2,3-dioxygenase